MERRRFLAAVVGSGAAALAGCTGGGGSSPATDAESPTGSAASTASSTPSGEGEFPRITDRSFSRTGDADGSGESASVAFDGDLVRVTGVVRGANGCMEASLADAEYDREADELGVRVTTVREGGDVCTQEIVHRSYEAAVEFAGGCPMSVVVEHESMDEVRTVADVTR